MSLENSVRVLSELLRRDLAPDARENITPLTDSEAGSMHAEIVNFLLQCEFNQDVPLYTRGLGLCAGRGRAEMDFARQIGVTSLDLVDKNEYELQNSDELLQVRRITSEILMYLLTCVKEGAKYDSVTLFAGEYLFEHEHFEEIFATLLDYVVEENGIVVISPQSQLHDEDIWQSHGFKKLFDKGTYVFLQKKVDEVE